MMMMEEGLVRVHKNPEICPHCGCPTPAVSAQAWKRLAMCWWRGMEGPSPQLLTGATLLPPPRK